MQVVENLPSVHMMNGGMTRVLNSSEEGLSLSEIEEDSDESEEEEEEEDLYHQNSSFVANSMEKYVNIRTKQVHFKKQQLLNSHKEQQQTTKQIPQQSSPPNGVMKPQKKNITQVVVAENKNDEVSFQPTYEVCTPKLTNTNLQYRPLELRGSNFGVITDNLPTQSSVARPNYEDCLRRVAVVVYQHIGRCERRFRIHQNSRKYKKNQVKKKKEAATNTKNRSSKENGRINNRKHVPEVSTIHSTKFNSSANSSSNSVAPSSSTEYDIDKGSFFYEEHFVSPQYKYTFVRLPLVHPLSCYMMQKVQLKNTHIPSVDEIYLFCKTLFNRAQLSAECIIVCLIYVERLMEQANIPLLGRSWKPILLCGLLLASKVWQDLSSWNVEFSSIYPQFPLHCINRLERQFLHHIQWDLYISGSVYAKYFFALRSLSEKKDFRRRYNYTMQVNPPNSKRLEERSQAIENQLYSRSV